MSFLLLLAGLCSSALAADEAEVLVVGVHVAGLTPAASAAAADSLAAALDATGKVDALPPIEVSRRIAGRESLILDTYALGVGRDRLRKGRLLYEGAQPDQAIPELEDAVKALTAGLSVSTDARDVHEGLMLLGMSYVGMGNEEAARRAFRRSAVLDPTRELNEVSYPPDVVALFNEARAEAQTEAPGELSVTANRDAQVWVDGRNVGKTPQIYLKLLPGEHFVLVRDDLGQSVFQTFVVTSGESRKLDAGAAARSLGVAAADPSARSRQTRDLYRAVGQYVGTTAVLLAGTTSDGQVAVQLYSPASGNFSRALTGESGADPVTALVELAPTVAGYLGETGDIRADRVGSQILPLDVGANDVLAGLLLNPPAPDQLVVEVPKGPRWYVWAGAGALVAGGGATAAVLVLTQTGDAVDANQGTIEFGPIP